MISALAPEGVISVRRNRLQFQLIAGLGMLAFLLRVAPLVVRADLGFAFFHDDSFWMLQTANGMLHGCGFARWINGGCAAPEIMRTPGYPLMLAMMPGTRWTLAVQALMGCTVCVLVAYWVWRCWGAGAALIAELLIALDVPSIVYANLVMSEQRFQLMLVIAIVPPLLVTSGKLGGARATVIAFSCAIIAGFAILVRPIGILIPLLTPIPFLFSGRMGNRHRIALGAIALALPALTAVGWSLRNYAETGYFGVSIEGPIQLYYFRAAEVVARENGSALMAAQEELRPRLGVGIDRVYNRDVQSAQLAQRMDDLAANILLAYPKQTLAMIVESAIYVALFPDRSKVANLIVTTGGSQGFGLIAGAPSAGRLVSELAKLLRSPVLTGVVVFEVLMGLAMWVGITCALLRCLQAPTDYRVWVLYLTLVSITLIAVGAGGDANVRFRMPLVPLLAIVAGLGYLPLPDQLYGFRKNKATNTCPSVGQLRTACDDAASPTLSATSSSVLSGPC